jgi:hypothetical protein
MEHVTSILDFRKKSALFSPSYKLLHIDVVLGLFYEPEMEATFS